MRVRPQDDVAPPAAVAAIGPPLGDEFLAQKGDTAIPAVAGFCMDFDLIDEHGWSSILTADWTQNFADYLENCESQPAWKGKLRLIDGKFPFLLDERFVEIARLRGDGFPGKELLGPGAAGLAKTLPHAGVGHEDVDLGG